ACPAILIRQDPPGFLAKAAMHVTATAPCISVLCCGPLVRRRAVITSAFRCTDANFSPGEQGMIESFLAEPFCFLPRVLFYPRMISLPEESYLPHLDRLDPPHRDPTGAQFARRCNVLHNPDTCQD